MAAMIVLQELSPPQRVAFVLHDSCGLPFDEIGEILGCTATAARQHASRGRRALADARLPAREQIDEQRRVLTALVEALSSGDTDAVVRLLHPDVVSIGDGGGKAPAARRPVHGATAVAQLLSGLVRLYPGFIEQVEPVLVNGELGMALRRPFTDPLGRATVRCGDGRDDLERPDRRRVQRAEPGQAAGRLVALAPPRLTAGS